MNIYQRAKLSAYKLIVAEAKKALQGISKIPKFLKGINDLEEICNKIEALQVEQEKNTTGITANFRQSVDLLIDSMSVVAGAVQSHASEKGNNELLEKTNFTESALSSMRKQDIVAACAL